MNADNRSRIELAQLECEERIDRSKKDIARCLAQNLAWDHPTVRTHRSRLGAALIDLAIIERLLGGVS